MTDVNPLFQGFQPQAIGGPVEPLPAEKVKKPRKVKAPKVTKEPAPPKIKKARKPRIAKPTSGETAALPQYNLQTILQAMRSLEEADYAVFDKLFAVPEASRKRIMAALAKIFP